MAVPALTTRGASRPRRWTLSPSWVLAAVIVLALVSRYVILAGNGWAQDDNGYLVLAQQQGFGLHWLFSVQSTHWEPAVRAVFSVQNHLMPFDFRWGLVLMLLGFGAAVFTFERIMRMLVGGTWVPLLAAGFMAFSVFGIESLEWWTSGTEALPAMLCELVCVYAYLRYQERLSGRWIWVGAAALATGFLFYEKTVFVLLYLALVRTLLLCGEKLEPRAIGRVLWRERRMWLALIGVTICWAIIYAHAGGLSAGAERSVSLGRWLRFWRVYWVQTIVPSMIGVTFHASRSATISAGNMAVAITLQALLLALAAVSIRRRPGAWRAWAILLVCVVANGIPIGLDRLAVLGPAVATHLRYAIDFAWLTPLLVCLAHTRPPALDAPARREIGSRRLTDVRPGVLAAVLALAAGYLVLSTASAAKLQTQWVGRAARAWETNVAHLDSLGRPGRPVVVANDVVPTPIATFATPLSLNNLGAILPHYLGSDIRIDGPLVGPLVTIDQTGRPHGAALSPEIHKFKLPHAHCSSPSSAGAQLEWRLPSPLPAGSRYYLRLAYIARRTTSVQLLVDDGLGYFPSPDRFIGIADGRHESIGWLGVGAPHGIVLDVPAPAACVTDAGIVTIAPR